MKRSRSGPDLHIPALITPPLPLPLGVAEAIHDGGVDRHSPSTASIPSASILRGAQPANFSTVSGDDGADLIGMQGFTSPTSTVKPASSVYISRLAPMSSSIRSAAAPKLISCAGDLRPQLAAATDDISDKGGSVGGAYWPCRSYGCSFCGREFNSAQALGGHMNIHRRDRARLRTSLENFPPSTWPAAHSQATMLASPHAGALPHLSLAAISGSLAAYPVSCMAPLISPDNTHNINPLIRAPNNSESARVSPFVTEQKYPFYHSYYSQSPCGVPNVLSKLPADADADAVATPGQLPAPPLSDYPLQSTEKSERLMVAPTSMVHGGSMSRTSACHTTASSTRLAAVVPFPEGERCAALSSSHETSWSAGTVDSSSALRTRDLNSSLHVMPEGAASPAANYRHESFSSGVDLELRLGTQPTRSR